MPLLTDRSAMFALGLLGVLGYYAAKAAGRRTVAVVLPQAADARYRTFLQGVARACGDHGCMLHYVCVPDLYHRYDAMQRALASAGPPGSPVVCRIPDQRTLAAIEQSGRKFVAIMSPKWVAKSPAHIASLMPWEPSELPASTVVITSPGEWIPGALVADASSFMEVAASASRQARNLLVADHEAILAPNRAAAALGHLFSSVRTLRGPTLAEGYEAVRLALASG